MYSLIPLLAAVTIAVTTRDYTTASIFFAFGWLGQVGGEIKDLRKRVDRLYESDIEPLHDQIKIVGRYGMDFREDVRKIENRLRKVVESIKNLD